MKELHTLISVIAKRWDYMSYGRLFPLTNKQTNKPLIFHDYPIAIIIEPYYSVKSHLNFISRQFYMLNQFLVILMYSSCSAENSCSSSKSSLLVASFSSSKLRPRNSFPCTQLLCHSPSIVHLHMEENAYY